jgi:hypothetical protein
MLLRGPVFPGGLMMPDNTFNSLCHLFLMSFSLRPLPNSDAIFEQGTSSAIIFTIVASTSAVQVMLLCGPVYTGGFAAR